MRKSIGRANSLPQLAYLAAGLPALNRDLAGVLEEVLLPAEVKSRLGLVAFSGRMTVRSFLQQRELHRELERSGAIAGVLAGFQGWVERAASSPIAARPLERGAPLEALIASTEVPDLWHWNAGMLSRDMLYEIAGRTLGELAKRALSPRQERALRDGLLGLQSRVRQARASAPRPAALLLPALSDAVTETGAPGANPAEPAAAAPTSGGGPAQDRLPELARALAALREPMLHGWPRGLVDAGMRFDPVGDDLRLELTIGGDDREQDRDLGPGYRRGGNPYGDSDLDNDFDNGDDLLDAPWTEAPPRAKGARGGLPTGTKLPPPGFLLLPRLSEQWRRPELICWCGRDACVHRAKALDLLLRELALPKSAAVRLIARLVVPAWQRALDLMAAPAPEGKRSAPGSLSFLVDLHGISALFHVEGKRGPSKRGQPIRDVTEYLPRLRGHDRKIAEAWALSGSTSSSRSRPSTTYYGDGLLLLEGHPEVRLRTGGPCVPVRVERATVRVQEVEHGVELSVVVAGAVIERASDAQGFRCTSGMVLLRPGEDVLRLVLLPDELMRLIAAFEQSQLAGRRFPREALPQLVGLLPALEAVTVVELPDDLRGEEQPAQSRAVLRVEPAGAGLRLSVRSEPLPGGPLFVPGHGGPLSASFDGQRRRFARRAFERELAEATALAAELGLDPAAAEEPFTWPLEPGDQGHGVDTLLRIHHLAARGQAVEWSAPKPKFTRAAKMDKLKLRIERRRDWFGLDGEVEVDERRVGLAALLEAARARRRWVQLGPGDYAELSEELIERLRPLAHLAGKEPTPTLTLGSVPLVEALAGEVEGLEAAEGWRKLSEKLAQAREKPFPLPAGLKAELREYQVEGFRWMSRLADWGAGACLADDMGLGKTLQALALLLSRAPLGPALVVAPSSVLHTWRTEAARFAPSLSLRLFHEGDRDLAATGPGDVVVVSWSLLARQAALFRERRFATAVLDEAHAIKNAGTQRAKAAHGLTAEFTVALTGTPVENHVGELWSLLRAVMPSLLGSEESFRLRFASGAPEATRALAALVQPFILRRTKGQVARELPARTEVELLVPLSPEERALYDDVRLAAAADLGTVTGEDHRFQVLALLTRLRLTACHPRIQEPGWKGPTSKLTRLLELLRDLSASGHRALVFSQFTQHLALVAEALRAEGIFFSYLDGQVPLAERQRRVESFQAGEGGDLFLISLKAGGTGLTLTAADYVIHLDPWWNPAVEDQASDRAHRIGQTRPVTVYRLIAEGTIEQQILSLHREKREMVDALLSGADRAGKLTAEQLAGLIRGE